MALYLKLKERLARLGLVGVPGKFHLLAQFILAPSQAEGFVLTPS